LTNNFYIKCSPAAQFCDTSTGVWWNGCKPVKARKLLDADATLAAAMSSLDGPASLSPFFIPSMWLIVAFVAAAAVGLLLLLNVAKGAAVAPDAAVVKTRSKYDQPAVVDIDALRANAESKKTKVKKVDTNFFKD
jgi:hypothetical protein